MDFKEMINGFNNRGRFRLFVKSLDLEDATSCPNNKISITKYANLDHLILLNKHNSDIIEEQISGDPNYIQFTKMLIQYYIDHSDTTPKAFPKYNREAVLAIVRMIDVENSTNVWRFNREKVFEMVDYIIDRDKNFWSDLIDEDVDKRKQLVKSLANSSPDEDSEEEGEEERNDTIKPNSLASKICKYFAQYIENDENQKLYFINDSFVRSTLLYYYYFYTGEELTKKEINAYTYDKLFDKLDEILDKANKDIEDENLKITRGRMDHIMWYCYKNSGNINRTIYEEAAYYFADKAALLYGILKMDTAIDFINNLNEKFAKKKPFNSGSFVNNLPRNCEIKEINGTQYLVNTNLSEETITRLIERQNSEGFLWHPSRLGEKNLADFGNTHTMKLRDWMLVKFGNESRERIDNNISVLLNNMLNSDESDIEAILNDLSTGIFDGVRLTKKEKTELRNAIMDLLKKTQLPKYGGHHWNNTRVL